MGRLFLAATLIVVLGSVSTGVAEGTSLDIPPAPWIDDQAHDGIVYFLYSHPARLERFDLDGDIWLPPVVLPQTPCVFDVGDDGIFVVFRSGLVSRFDHLGGSEFPIIQFSTEPSSVNVIGEILLVINNSPSEEIYTFTTTGVLIDSDEFTFYRMWALAPAPVLGRVFGNLEDRAGYLELGRFGQIGKQTQMTFDSSLYAMASWLSPDSGFVIYDTGELRFTDTFTAMTVDLGGAMDGLVFSGELPVVLRDDRLIGYSRAFHRTGEVDLGLTARRVLLHGDAIAVFYLGHTGVEVLWVPVSALNQPPWDEPVDPRGLSFTPDDVEIDHRGIVYLLSRDYESVFRFSTTSGDYLESIPTNGRTTMIAYSPVDDRLFIGYQSGRVGKVQLGPSGKPSQESGHVNVPSTLYGLTAVSEYLLTADHASDRETIRTFDAQGDLVSEFISYYGAPGHQWCAETRRVYYTDSTAGPTWLFSNPIDTNGVIGSETRSMNDYGNRTSIRVKDDGSKVLVQSGDIYDGDSLELLEEIGASHLDASWVGSDIVTVVEDGGGSRLIAYAADLSVMADVTISGPPVRLLPTDSGVVLISSNPSGRPAYSHWDSNLDCSDLSVYIDDGEDQVAAGSPLTWSVSVSSLGSQAADDLTVISMASAHLADLSWTCSATPPSACGVSTGTGAISDTATVDPAGTLVYTLNATVNPSAQGTIRQTVRVDPVSGRGWEDTDLTEVWDPLETFLDGFEDGTTGAWGGATP